jgi:hypothetical protein
MKEIQAEGIKFIYLTPNEGLPHGTMNGLKIAEAPRLEAFWDKVKAHGLNDIRLILMQYGKADSRGHIQFLHWDDSPNLQALDEKIAKGTFGDEDFKNSVITTFGRTLCTQCGWEGHTLVLFTADAYALKPDLELKKIRERQARQGFKICPNCGIKLRQMVVKIF